MHNLIVGGSTPQSVKDSNDRVIETALTYDLYSHWISANELELSSGLATYTAATGSEPGHWNLFEGSAGYLSGYVRRHQEWRDGTIGANIHWSANTKGGGAKVATWRMGLGIAALKPVGVGFPTPTKFAWDLSFDTDWSLIVSELRSASLNAESAITAKHGGVWVLIGKEAADAGDTCTSDRNLYGIEIFYRQRTNQAGQYKTG